MFSRETRVILGSFCLALIAIAGLLAARAVLGLPSTNGPLLPFLIYAGLTVVLPQLYLARTDATVSPRSRVRFAVIVTIVLAAGFVTIADGPQTTVIGAIAAAAFLALVGYEFYAGYRDSRTDEPLADLGR